MFLLVPLAFSLLGCQDESHRSQETQANTPANLYIDTELQPLLDEYIRQSADAGVPIPEHKLQEFKALMWTDDVTVKGPLEGEILGHCQRRATNSLDPAKRLRFIELLRPNSEGKVGITQMDEITLKVITFHELGHCLHDFDGHTNSNAAAIMNARLQPARYFDLDGLIMDHFATIKKMQNDPSFRP